MNSLYGQYIDIISKKYIKKGDFPNAEFVGERTISLPLGANLTEKDVNDVIGAVKSILNLCGLKN